MRESEERVGVEKGRYVGRALEMHAVRVDVRRSTELAAVAIVHDVPKEELVTKCSIE